MPNLPGRHRFSKQARTCPVLLLSSSRGSELAAPSHPMTPQSRADTKWRRTKPATHQAGDASAAISPKTRRPSARRHPQQVCQATVSTGGRTGGSWADKSFCIFIQAQKESSMLTTLLEIPKAWRAKRMRATRSSLSHCAPSWFRPSSRLPMPMDGCSQTIFRSSGDIRSGTATNMVKACESQQPIPHNMVLQDMAQLLSMLGTEGVVQQVPCYEASGPTDDWPGGVLLHVGLRVATANQVHALLQKYSDHASLRLIGCRMRPERQVRCPWPKSSKVFSTVLLRGMNKKPSKGSCTLLRLCPCNSNVLITLTGRFVNSNIQWL